MFLDSLFSSSKEFSINKNYITQFPLRKHFDGLTKDVNNQNKNALWKFNQGEFFFTDEENTLLNYFHKGSYKDVI